jgi:hypothetical protein
VLFRPSGKSTCLFPAACAPNAIAGAAARGGDLMGMPTEGSVRFVHSFVAVPTTRGLYGSAQRTILM